MLKSSDVITYDNMGNIIPLSQRDDFEMNDFRYKLEEIFKHLQKSNICKIIIKDLIKY